MPTQLTPPIGTNLTGYLTNYLFHLSLHMPRRRRPMRRGASFYPLPFSKGMTTSRGNMADEKPARRMTEFRSAGRRVTYYCGGHDGIPFRDDPLNAPCPSPVSHFPPIDCGATLAPCTGDTLRIELRSSCISNSTIIARASEQPRVRSSHMHARRRRTQKISSLSMIIVLSAIKGTESVQQAWLASWLTT